MSTPDTPQQEQPDAPRSGFIKGLPKRQKWVADGERDAELAQARASAYYWWWMFLLTSRDYRRAYDDVRHGRSGTDADHERRIDMARDFGAIHVRRNFDSWWLDRGRDLFSEQLVIPKVRALGHGDAVNLEQINAKLVLEIPLTVRRRTLMKQISAQLDRHHAGRSLRLMRHSTAQRQLNPDSRMRIPTMELLHRIWTHRRDNPDQSLYALGEALRLSPVFICRESDSDDERAYKQRCMTIVVQRYLRKAEALIYWAARGKFPCVEKCPLEGQVVKG
jgi:hypothetical protein